MAQSPHRRALSAALACGTLLRPIVAPNTTHDVAEEFQHRCDIESTPMLHPDPSAPAGFEAALNKVTEITPIRWRTDWEFADKLVEYGQPMVLYGTVVDTWQARNWTWKKLQDLYKGEIVENVMESDGHLMMKPDLASSLGTMFRYHQPLRINKMKGPELFKRMEEAQLAYDSMGGGTHITPELRKTWRSTGKRIGVLTKMPLQAEKQVQPEEWMYVTHKDNRRADQSIWVSTPGLRTHTHFDNDHNMFIQLIGRKRFVMWAPNQTRKMCPFPRLHPLWHKSRADFEQPDQKLISCAAYSETEAQAVDVGPGDVLYLPPFWWHTVETISPSVSLSTLSMYGDIYHHMRSIHDLDHFFDHLHWYDAKLYALRAYLSLLLQKVMDMKQDEEHDFFEEVLARYDGLEGELHAAPHDDDVTMCVLDKRGTPVCQHCLSHANWDAQIVRNHLHQLPERIRRTLLEDYVEQVSVGVVGVDRVQTFWRECFRGQPYFMTKQDSWEHNRLWERYNADADLADLAEDDEDVYEEGDLLRKTKEDEL